MHLNYFLILAFHISEVLEALLKQQSTSATSVNACIMGMLLFTYAYIFLIKASRSILHSNFRSFLNYWGRGWNSALRAKTNLGNVKVREFYKYLENQPFLDACHFVALDKERSTYSRLKTCGGLSSRKNRGEGTTPQSGPGVTNSLKQLPVSL